MPIFLQITSATGTIGYTEVLTVEGSLERKSFQLMADWVYLLKNDHLLMLSVCEWSVFCRADQDHTSGPWSQRHGDDVDYETAHPDLHPTGFRVDFDRMQNSTDFPYYAAPAVSHWTATPCYQDDSGGREVCADDDDDDDDVADTLLEIVEEDPSQLAAKDSGAHFPRTLLTDDLFNEVSRSDPNIVPWPTFLACVCDDAVFCALMGYNTFEMVSVAQCTQIKLPIFELIHTHKLKI